MTRSTTMSSAIPGPDSRIYVAGHRGLAGSAIVRRLRSAGHERLILRSHAELDLTDQGAVRQFVSKERPEYVFLAAARVGGILANNTYPAQFIRDNLAIQTNVIHEAWRVGVRRLLFLGSSCIYPRACPQPMREDDLLTGQLEPTNRPYAVAKIAGIEMCWAYNREYAARFLAAMPTNLYGPGDHFDLATSHVIPALLRKFHEAKLRGEAQVVVWGTGRPRREFLHSDDMADACVFLMNLPERDFQALLASERNDGVPPVINIGTGVDLSIGELAALVKEVTRFGGEILYDHTKPDGMPQKLEDVSRLRALGWGPRISLKDGLTALYADMIERGDAPVSSVGD